MSISFVALDFETANSNRASVCEVGLSKVIDGERSAVFSSLVLPPKSVGHFAARNIRIHGIQESDVLSSPEWGDIWPEAQVRNRHDLSPRPESSSKHLSLQDELRLLAGQGASIQHHHKRSTFKRRRQ